MIYFPPCPDEGAQFCERDGVAYYNSGSWTDFPPTYLTIDSSGVRIHEYREAAQERAVAQVEKMQGHKPKVYSDMRRLFEDREIQAVSMATPNHWHALGAIWACQAGKDVYVEKPGSHNIWEGRKMVEAARKYKRVFTVGSQQRSMWPNHAGCELVRTGKLGKIKRVIAHNYPSPWESDLPAQPAGSD